MAQEEIQLNPEGPSKDQPGPSYNVIVYHHTHWDREWWATMQDFRIRLVELIDELLDTLDSDPEFRCFLLDGQTIVLKDYLEIRPENEKRLVGYINAGRIQCGPWYILPDEFLVSGEAHVRNLWLGRRMAEKLGFDNLDVGYIPDTFGHISQMPQLFQGFGVDSAMVWRGLGGPEDTFKQEFWWEAPDGTRVFTYWFPDGYYVVDFLHFENPAKTYDETFGRVRRSLEKWSRRAATKNLIMPYGGDHRLIDKRLPRLIKTVNEDFGDFAQLHIGTTKEFIEAVRAQNPQLDTKRGELRETGADLPHLLTGVLSSRMYLKRLNHTGQNALERYAEPFSALAWLHGRRYNASLLWTAWELLVQNHPHDSICGCSIDQVHREMLPRFAQSKQIADIVTEKSVQHLNAQIDTSAAASGQAALVVHNPLSWTRGGTAAVDVPRDWRVHPRTHSLTDASGREVPFQAKEIAVEKPMTDKWQYTQVIFAAEDVQGFGYRTYTLAKRDKELDPKKLYFASARAAANLKGSGRPADLRIGADYLENDLLRAAVHPADGTLTVTDKTTGLVYEGLNAFEDGGDAGDTYNWSRPLADRVLRTTDASQNVRVHVSVAEAGYARATLRVDIDWALPARLSEDRLSRAADYTPVRLTSFVTLAAGSGRLDIRTEWANTVEDHRLRALLPLGVPAGYSEAEGHFDVVRREVPPTDGNVPADAAKPVGEIARAAETGTAGWAKPGAGAGITGAGDGWPEIPSPPLPQTGFVSISAEGRGLTVANRGLPEFELLADERGTLALTLLRAVGWLSREDTMDRVGGAGPETPVLDAQSLGANAAEYSIIVHADGWLESRSYRQVHEYLAPLYGSHTGAHEGELPPDGGWIELSGDHTLMLSACKKAENAEALILRFWNTAKEPTEAQVKLLRTPSVVRYSDLRELPVSGGTIEITEDGSFTVQAGAASIVTLEIVL